jgi:hypothetical protein
MMANPPVNSKSSSAFMRKLPQVAMDAAEDARAKARATGTPIVIVRDGVTVHEYDLAPLSDDNGAEPGDRKRA